MTTDASRCSKVISSSLEPFRSEFDCSLVRALEIFLLNIICVWKEIWSFMYFCINLSMHTTESKIQSECILPKQNSKNYDEEKPVNMK